LLEIRVKDDIKKLTRGLRQFQGQIPYATAVALTTTAKDVQRAETRQIPVKLDRPTAFTRNAIGITGANKRNLMAAVFVKDAQAEYLRWQIEGGTRRTPGRGTGVPTRAAKLNQFGNIPGRRRGIIKGKRQFVATIQGIAGVWERPAKGGGRTTLVVAFEPEVKYEKRFPFYAIGQGVVASKFQRNFSAAFMKAVRSAR